MTANDIEVSGVLPSAGRLLARTRHKTRVGALHGMFGRTRVRDK